LAGILQADRSRPLHDRRDSPPAPADRAETNTLWVTAAIEGDASEVDIHIGVRHALTARQPEGDRENAGALAPFDLLLASLGACTALTLKRYAASRDWPLEVVEVDLEIVSRQTSASVTRLLSLQGSLDVSQREALLAAAELSPVTLLLSPGVHMHTELA
jgi:putative redox protein